MKCSFIPSVSVVVAMAVLPIVSTADPDDAESLHKRACQSCHIDITDGDGSVIYTRVERRAVSREALRDLVRYFVQGLELDWTEEQINAVTRLLDQRYYGFPPDEK